MTEYIIVLKPVYSETVETPKGIEIPDGWRLAWHQLETFKALQDPDIDVVFNTAMTGDGKSLSAYLSAMTGKNYTLAMYPTNELARDQEKQVGSSGFMGISTANSNQNPLGATVTALPCRQ